LAHAFEIIEVLFQSANELPSKHDLLLLRTVLADGKLSCLYTGAAVETDDH
jgi:hypothetical protein